LEKAKEAGKKERQLCREREKNGLADQINSDLTYAVCFNLANQYDACGMYTEALNTYSLIVKDKNYPNAGRLRVNMGNIFFKKQNYPNAIKMYRMAMDQVQIALK
jgi:intraflagellar transport protein 88